MKEGWGGVRAGGRGQQIQGFSRSRGLCGQHGGGGGVGATPP